MINEMNDCKNINHMSLGDSDSSNIKYYPPIMKLSINEEYSKFT